MLYVDADFIFKQMTQTQPGRADLAIVCEFRECAKWVVYSEPEGLLEWDNPSDRTPQPCREPPNSLAQFGSHRTVFEEVIANQKIVESDKTSSILGR